MTPPMEFSSPTASDAHSIAEVFLASIKSAMPWLSSPHSDDDVHRWIAEVVIPSGTLEVIKLQGETAGLMALENGWIQHLYIHPSMQGVGIGSSCVQRAKSLYPSGLQLWTFQRNQRARQFYERRGFVCVEETDGAGNEEREPDARYLWQP